MFDRYTEKARRVLFFARYEASQFGAHQIETEHLLLGLLREDPSVLWHLMPRGWTAKSIRREIESSTLAREKIPTSVDMPLSTESKNVLTYATEEADSLGDKNVDTKHLLLGILREEKCFAAGLLREGGLRLSSVREILANLQHAIDEGVGSGVGIGSGGGFDLSGTAGGTLFGDGTIEFVNEVDGKLIGISPRTPVPYIGTEVVLGGVRARVTRVAYRYERMTPPKDITVEGDRLVPQKIVVSLQLLPQ
ncbi:MAG: hypothetical protein DMG60_18530 [Acidobacteria bacterium]|nr:MAG: hypothetical protein DMG60_18530 [Acidobacteriota bacterium]